MVKEKNSKVAMNVFNNIQALQPGQKISLHQHLARLEQIRQERIRSLEQELAMQKREGYPKDAIVSTEKDLAVAKNSQLSLDKDGLLAIPAVSNPWYGFLKDYQRGNIGFANKSQRWVGAQLVSVDEAIERLQNEVMPVGEKKVLEQSARELVASLVNLDLSDVREQLVLIEEEIDSLSQRMDTDAQQASKPLAALQRRKTVVQLYLQLKKQLDAVEKTDESERGLVLANIELCVQLDLINQEIELLDSRELAGQSKVKMTMLRNNFDRMVTKIKEKFTLQKENKIVFGEPTDAEAIESLTHLIRAEFKDFDDAAVLALVLTLQQKVGYFHSEQIVVNPDPSKYPRVSQGNNQVVVKKGGRGNIIFTVYTDIVTPENGSISTFRSDFKIDIKDLSIAGAEQKAAPIKFIETRILAPDLKTVLSLFDKIDPNNLDAVLNFVENVLSPYMDRLVDFRENCDDKENKLALLLANMQKEKLNRVGFALLQKIYQAQKTLTTNDNLPHIDQLLQASGGLKYFLQMAKEYKRTDFVKQLLENQFEALDKSVVLGKRPNPVVSLEELKQKTENMSESELDEFETFLELWYEALKNEGKQADRDVYRKLFTDYVLGRLPQQYDDIDTVLSLWGEIDPTDRKAVFAFVKNILNPYIDGIKNHERNRYDLLLMSDVPPTGPEEGKMYLEKEVAGLKYIVITPQGKQVSDSLDIAVDNLTKESLALYRDAILKKTSKRGHTQRNLDLILLAEAESRGLNTIRPSLMQAVFQTKQTLENVCGEINANANVTADGQLAYDILKNGDLRYFSEMVLYHGRKEQPKLPELLRTVITLPEEGIVTIEKLKAKTQQLNEDEFKDFEISLNVLMQSFDKDSYDFPVFQKKISNFNGDLDKFKEAQSLHQKERLKHEANVRERYQKIFQLKFIEGVEGVVAARRKQVEIGKNISVTSENPTHKRYDQLAYRQKVLTQEQQVLADTRRGLDAEDRKLDAQANKTRSRRVRVLLGIATVFTFGLVLIPVALSNYRRKQEINKRRSEIAVSKKEIALRGDEIAAPLIKISAEMERIRVACKQNPYIACTGEELEATLLGIDKLCQVEADIVTNREKRNVKDVDAVRNQDIAELRGESHEASRKEQEPIAVSPKEASQRVVVPPSRQSAPRLTEQNLGVIRRAASTLRAVADSAQQSGILPWLMISGLAKVLQQIRLPDLENISANLHTSPLQSVTFFKNVEQEAMQENYKDIQEVNVALPLQTAQFAITQVPDSPKSKQFLKTSNSRFSPSNLDLESHATLFKPCRVKDDTLQIEVPHEREIKNESSMRPIECGS